MVQSTAVYQREINAKQSLPGKKLSNGGPEGKQYDVDERIRTMMNEIRLFIF